MTVVIGKEEYFKGIPAIQFEGPESANPMAFRYYDADRVVAGKTMAEHMRFAVAYWHTFKGTGADPFGGGVYTRPWDQGASEMDVAFNTQDAAFEFVSKLGAPFYCFHDADIAPQGNSLSEFAANLDAIVKRAKTLQDESGVKLLWGTANAFSHARYSDGAATNPDPRIFACAATQVRHALEATHYLGGTGYVFWGGREGYSTLLNTNLKQEREQLAALLQMAVDHADKIGFTGKFFIEPKPKEPSTHQYDFDAATVLGFLNEFGLADRFALNIEANHATLAGHTFEHELEVASSAGMLGSVDVNTGNPTLGWDTDEFGTDVKTAALAMRILLKQDGLTHGGLNFDAKVRRASFALDDLFIAHISSMDVFAHGLLIADKMEQDGALDKPLADRYAGYNEGMGKKILDGTASLEELEAWILPQGEPEYASGRQELLEATLNRYVYSGIK